MACSGPVCSPVISVGCSLTCKPPAAVAGLMIPTLPGPRPLKHHITGIYIRGTHLYAHTREHLNISISVCLEILAMMQASVRSACKQPGRKVRIVIADMPEEKTKPSSPAAAAAASTSGNGSNRHASISRAGPSYQLPPRRGSDTLAQIRIQFSETKDLLAMRAIDLHR